MSEEKDYITYKDKKFFVEDMSDTQKSYRNHIKDLDQKLAEVVVSSLNDVFRGTGAQQQAFNAQFNIDQLLMGRQKAFKLLVDSLEKSLEAESEDGK